MTKSEFRGLFSTALERAIDIADKQMGTQVPRTLLVELHGGGCSGQNIEIDEALNRLYLGSDRFFKIVDIAVVEVLPETSVVFVRISGHAPVPFDATFDAHQLGPFKQLESIVIKDNRS